MRVVGVSFAGPDVNARWTESQRFGFPIWTDQEKTLALHYGAVSSPGAAFPKRITKVLDASGTLVLEYVSDVDVGTHPEEVLEDCRVLFGGARAP